MSVAIDRIAIGRPANFSDIALIIGVIAVIGAMIFPLPSVAIDILVALSLLSSFGLLLLSIYVPNPVAFSSFPSVLLLSVLFRLSLSVAITRKILLEADGGRIVETFGNFVVGGNLVVGIVVFLIITVVQFIVVAKGAERVAEVSARFTLDAMPGKQLSIDSDLRSGLIEKDEARRRRKHLEIESQLHGSLDGAMKYVKGDAIAGIVIILVNLIAGIAIGVVQLGMSASEAMLAYSVLTVGDGLVAQIPAMLNAMAAGLLVTRISADERDANLGQAIVGQVSGYPRVTLIAGGIAMLLCLMPGFPWPVFLVLGLGLLGWWAWGAKAKLPWVAKLLRAPTPTSVEAAAQIMSEPALDIPAPLAITITPELAARLSHSELSVRTRATIEGARRDTGVPLPDPRISIDSGMKGLEYRIDVHGSRAARGVLLADRQWEASAEATTPDTSPPLPGRWIESAAIDVAAPIEAHLRQVLARQSSLFVGIQETVNLINRMARDYPDLIKETLRLLAPQRIAEVLRRLVDENVPIRHLRDVFEALADAGGREKDVLLLTEYVRVGMRRHLCERVADGTRALRVAVTHPELEDKLRQSVRSGATGPQLALDPELARRVIDRATAIRREHGASGIVLLCSLDVRRHLRKLIELECFELPVMSFQELTPDLSLNAVAQLTA
jgi:type III secretion protein V